MVISNAGFLLNEKSVHLMKSPRSREFLTRGKKSTSYASLETTRNIRYKIILLYPYKNWIIK